METRKAALAALLLMVVACATPARAAGKGVYEPMPLRDSEVKLIENSGATEDLFQRRGYRYSEAGLEELVARIGARLAPKPTDPYIRWRFHVLRDPQPNAFALPDGQVYVNTGLLAILENEAQLAAILAHEVQHAAGHHGLRTYRSVKRKMITSMVLGPLTLGVGDIFLALSVMGYSRDLEEEADALGARRMLEAGYDPRQMARTFELLDRDPEGELIRVKSKWSTHPDLTARVETTRGLAQEMLKQRRGADLKMNGPGFRALARRASLDTVQDLVAGDYPRTAVVLARALLRERQADAERHLALGDALRGLGAREMITDGDPLNRRQKRQALWARATLTRDEREGKRLETPEGRQALKRNLEQARQAYQEALRLQPGLAEARRGLGYALKGLGRPIDAGKEFVAYLKARPRAEDRAVVLAELQEINQQVKKGVKK
jgi:predicted Zn-dependent protease